MEFIKYVSVHDIKLFNSKGGDTKALSELIAISENEPKRVFGFNCRIPIIIKIPA